MGLASENETAWRTGVSREEATSFSCRADGCDRVTEAVRLPAAELD